MKKYIAGHFVLALTALIMLIVFAVAFQDPMVESVINFDLGKKTIALLLAGRVFIEVGYISTLRKQRLRLRKELLKTSKA